MKTLRPFLKTLSLLILPFSMLLMAWQSLRAQPQLHNVPLLQALPRLAHLEKIVLTRAGLDPQNIKQWQKGSRWAAALPRIQVGWESKLTQQNTSISQDSISVTSAGITIGPESNRVDYDAENNQDVEVKAVWALDELLFNRNQIEISREARDLMFARNRLIEELHQTYFDLKSHLLALQASPHLQRDKLFVLKVERLVSKLNSLSGGAFEAQSVLNESAQKL